MKNSRALREVIELLQDILQVKEYEEAEKKRQYFRDQKKKKKKTTPTVIVYDDKTIFTPDIRVIDAVFIEQDSDVYRIIPGSCSSCALFNSNACTHPLCLRYKVGGEALGRIRCFEYCGKIKDNIGANFLFSESQKNEEKNKKIIKMLEQ